MVRGVRCMSTDRWSLQGKTVVVTGGTKGIGRAIVDELLGKQAKVVTCARNASDVKEMQRTMDPDRVLVLQADVTKQDERQEVPARASN